MENQTGTLVPGTVINGPERAYTIIRVLGQGGFGITYLVTGKVMVGNISVDVKFALKEHFISSLCSRDGMTHTVQYSAPVAEEVNMSLKSFIREAQRLQGLGISHPNIVKINEVFEANNTAYYVMEYLGGTTLQDYVTANGAMSPQAAKQLLRPVVEAVATLHRNHIAHYDIKPGNIMLYEDESGNVRPVLIDFGLSKHYNDSGAATSTLAAAGYSPGYAPVEQYAGIGEFSPQCDVYALAATLYYCLTGRTPKTAFELRPADIENDLAYILTTDELAKLTQALAMMKEARTPDAGALYSDVFNDNTYGAAPPPQPPIVNHAGKTHPLKKRGIFRKRLPIIGALSAIIVAVVAVTVYWWWYPSHLTKKGDAFRTDENYGEAMACYLKAADMGNSESQYQLGMMYLAGQGVSADNNEAAKWFKMSADSGNAEAQYMFGLFYTLGIGVKEDVSMAAEYYRMSAEQGNAEAQCQLGNVYLDGVGVEQDYDKALKLYRQSAGQGNSNAEYKIGFMYDSGLGVPEDKAEAVAWYRKAVNHGNADAQVALGVAYDNGDGVETNHEEAVRLFTLAAENENSQANFNLGVLYDNGRGVPMDETKASEYFLKAAELGHVRARYIIGARYCDGTGVARNYDKGIEWLRKAVDEGDAEAQNYLGYMYENGLGVEKDYAKAFELYKAAADQDLPIAVSNVGVMYLNGYGVSADRAEAKKWFQKAADLGYDEAAKILKRVY